jgi:hypothetical protein
MIRALVFLISYGVTAGLARAQDGGAQTWAAEPTDHFEIYYQSPQRSHVEVVAREAERAYARISLSLRHELAAKVPLILVREDRDLPRNEEQARALVTASRAGERDHLLLSVETFEKRPEVALAHELTHQFVFELLPQADRDAPWVSEALPDHHGGVWESSELVRVRDALAQGTVPALSGLTASTVSGLSARRTGREKRRHPHGVRRVRRRLRCRIPQVRQNALRRSVSDA